MVSWAKFEGKRFTDPKCSGPLLQTLPLKVDTQYKCTKLSTIAILRYPRVNWHLELIHTLCHYVYLKNFHYYYYYYYYYIIIIIIILLNHYFKEN